MSNDLKAIVADMRDRATTLGPSSPLHHALNKWADQLDKIRAGEPSGAVAWLAEGTACLESWQPRYIVGTSEESAHDNVKESLVGWSRYDVFPVYADPPPVDAKDKELAGLVAENERLSSEPKP